MRTLMKTALMGATVMTMATAAKADLTADYMLSDQLTITENAAKVQNFSTLVAAAQAAGLADELMGEGPYTVFAPTDEAFAMLPEGTVENLLQPENREQLASLLRGHIIPEVITSDELETAVLGSDSIEIGSVTAMVENGTVMLDTLAVDSDVFINKKGSTFYVTADDAVNDYASIIEADIMSSNGVIHVIDTVLTPNM